MKLSQLTALVCFAVTLRPSNPPATASSPPLPLAPQDSFFPDDSHWSAEFAPPGTTGEYDGDVYDAVEWNGEIFIGGSFNWVDGRPVKNLARWDGISWKPLPASPPGTIVHLAVFQNQLIALTSMSDPNLGFHESFFAWDGSQWRAFGSIDSSGYVRDVRVFHDRLVGGGEFSSIGGVAASNIAMWNGHKWEPLGAGVNDHGVYALTEFQGDLYVGGWFGAAGGESAKLIARWDGSHWHALGDGLNGVVFDMDVFKNKLLVTGGFDRAGPYHDVNGFAAWDGETWEPLGQTLDHQARSVTPSRDYALIRGNFGQAGTITVDGVAEWDGTSWAPFRGNPTSPVSIWNAELLDLNDVWLVSGGWGGVGNSFGGRQGTWRTRSLATWDGDSWGSLATGKGLGSSGISLLNTGGELWVGGVFHSAGAASVSGIALWNGHEWHPGPPLLTSDPYPYALVSALIPYAGGVLAGGNFSLASDTTSANVAWFHNGSWEPLGRGLYSKYGGGVSALLEQGTDLIAGGFFQVSGLDSISNVARWDGTTWKPMGNGLDYTVHALALYHGTLIAGGRFWKSGPDTVYGIAAWNGQSWENIGGMFTSLGYAGEVNCLAVYEDELLVGGQFSRAGDVPVSNLAAWNGTTWRPYGDTDAPISSLTVIGDRLFVGGEFTLIGGTPANSIAVRENGEWRSLGSGVSGPVYSVCEYQGDTYLAGNFLIAGSHLSQGIARWRATEWPTTVEPLNLAASRTTKGIKLAWGLPLGLEFLGFQVLRSRFGEAETRLTEARLTGSLNYEFLDISADDRATTYRLEYETSEGTRYLGPVVVAANAVLYLSAALPNPFSGSTALIVNNPMSGPVSLRIYDISGRRVRNLLSGVLPPSEFRVTWDGRGEDGLKAAPGIYFCRLETASGTRHQRLVKLP